MTLLPKKIDTDAGAEPEPVSGREQDLSEELRIRELVEEGLASGPSLPVDDEFFKRLRKRVANRG